MATKSKAQAKADARYREKHVKRFTLLFFPKDMPIYEHLKSIDGQAAYIKNLIMDDMGITEEDLLRIYSEREVEKLPESHDWTTTNEVCAELNVSRQRVHQLIKSGELKSRKIGSRLQVRRDSLREYITKHQVR